MTLKSSGRNAWCFKCKSERDMVPRAGFQKLQVVLMKNNKPATKGRCGVCGTHLYRLGTYK
jgi:hypothetical protein